MVNSIYHRLYYIAYNILKVNHVFVISCNSNNRKAFNMFKLKTSGGKNNITSKNLTLIRQKQNISQRQLAKMLQLAGYDVDHHFIRRIETGDRFVTDMELVALSRVLNVSISDLIDETEELCTDFQVKE